MRLFNCICLVMANAFRIPRTCKFFFNDDPNLGRKRTLLFSPLTAKICQWLKYFCVNKGVLYDTVNTIRMRFSVLQRLELLKNSVWTPRIFEKNALREKDINEILLFSPRP